MIATFIAECCSDLPVSTCCRVMKVSTSGYYQRRAEPVTDTEWDEAHRADTVFDIWKMSRHSYGMPRIRDEFRLGRPNVLPVDDYGVRKGFALTFGKLKPTDKVTPMDLPKPDVMIRRAKKWQPWCSIASWYLWRACDLANNKTMTLPGAKD